MRNSRPILDWPVSETENMDDTIRADLFIDTYDVLLICSALAVMNPCLDSGILYHITKIPYTLHQPFETQCHHMVTLRIFSAIKA